MPSKEWLALQKMTSDILFWCTPTEGWFYGGGPIKGRKGPFKTWETLLDAWRSDPVSQQTTSYLRVVE